MLRHSAETRKFQAAFAVVVLFCFSMWMSVREARYMLFAQTTTGVVAEAKHFTSRGKYGSNEKMRVYFTYTNAAGEAKKDDQVFDAEEEPRYPRGGEVQVEFLSSGARLSGTGNPWMVLLLVGTGAAIGVVVFVFWRDYAEHQRLEARRREAYSTVR